MKAGKATVMLCSIWRYAIFCPCVPNSRQPITFCIAPFDLTFRWVSAASFAMPFLVLWFENWVVSSLDRNARCPLTQSVTNHITKTKTRLWQGYCEIVSLITGAAGFLFLYDGDAFDCFDWMLATMSCSSSNLSDRSGRCKWTKVKHRICLADCIWMPCWYQTYEYSRWQASAKAYFSASFGLLFLWKAAIRIRRDAPLKAELVRGLYRQMMFTIRLCA